MSPIDRRSFVGHTLTVLGAAAAPAWLARAFGFASPSAAAQDPQPAARKVDLVAWRKQPLAEALATAKAHGKPLLVLVVPDDQRAAGEASRWFGAWLTHGGEQAFLAFGSCTLACARFREVGAVLGVRGDALAPPRSAVTMLLVDPASVGRAEGGPSRVTRIELDALKRVDASRLLGDPSEESVRAGLDQMTDQLRAGLSRHGDELPSLALSALATLEVAEQRALQAFVRDGQEVPADLLVRGVAELQLCLPALAEAERAQRTKVLVQAIEQVVVRAQVKGSRWMSTSGCMAELENRTEGDFDPAMFSCGMGMVPPLCERFLGFYSVGS
ncbi:MAG: hypothetical protein ACK5UQ_12065 [Planctomycetota bacterium]